MKHAASIFNDVLGPIMTGPSSSHTAGAVRIGLVTRALLGQRPKKADITLVGSFAKTGRGHGTDKGIVAGLLGMQPEDMEIPDSFERAEEEGLKFNIKAGSGKNAHPNTAVIDVEGEGGRRLSVQASSTGGGRIMVNMIDGIEVNCTCEMPTLIVHNMDLPGHVSHVTGLLTRCGINIANMSLYRDRRGGSAVMAIETDEPLPREIVSEIEKEEGIIKVTYINPEDM